MMEASLYSTMKAEEEEKKEETEEQQSCRASAKGRISKHRIAPILPGLGYLSGLLLLFSRLRTE